MPYNANDASRARQLQQTHQHVQQQVHRMSKQHQAQAAKQMRDLMAGNAARAAGRRPGVDPHPGEEELSDTVRRPSRVGRVLWNVAVLVGAVVLCVVVVGVWQHVNDVSGTTGIRAAVQPGTSWNLRSGPSLDAPVIGSVTGGQTVVVRCVHGAWARLHEPRADAFVATAGLRLTGVPVSCSSEATQP
jgi:hypothetical protein